MSDEATTIPRQKNDEWIKGVTLAIAAAVVAGVSKLLIRKSWLLEDGGRRSTSPNRYGDEKIGSQEKFFTNDEINSAAAAALLSSSSSPDRRRSRSSGCVPCCPESSSSYPRRRRIPLLLRACGVFGVVVVHPVLALAAVSCAPPSLLVPFSGLTIVTVVILEGPVSGEWPSASRVGASAAVVVGGLLVALYGDQYSPYGVDAVMRHWRRDAGTIALEIATALLLWFLAIVALRSKESRWRRAAWGISCGTVLGWNAIVTKDAVTVLQSVKSLGYWNWPPVLFQLGAVSILLFLVGIMLLVFSMRWFDATSLASLIVGSDIVATSVVSAAHYDSFAHLTRTDAVCYLVGLALVLTGLCFMNATSVTVVMPAAGQKERDRKNEESGNGAIRVAYF